MSGPRRPTSRREYPPAPRLGVVDELHGEQVSDPYRWLEDPDSAETQAWADAQDELLATVLTDAPGHAA